MTGSAAVCFAQSLLRFQHVVRSINISHVGFGSKGASEILVCLLIGFDALVGSFVTNWGMSLGLEELDISGNEGEDASDKFAQYAMASIGYLLIPGGSTIWVPIPAFTSSHLPLALCDLL